MMKIIVNLIKWCLEIVERIKFFLGKKVVMQYQLKEYIPYISFSNNNIIRRIEFTADKWSSDFSGLMDIAEDKKVINNSDGSVSVILFVNLHFYDLVFLFGEIYSVVNIYDDCVDLGFVKIKVDNERFYKWIPKGYPHFYKFFNDFYYFMKFKGETIFKNNISSILDNEYGDEPELILKYVNDFLNFTNHSYVYCLLKLLPIEISSKMSIYQELTDAKNNLKLGAIFLKKYFPFFTMNILKKRDDL